MAAKKDKVLISVPPHARKMVECFGRFSVELGGETFELAVTSNVDGLGKSVTHLASGLRFCSVSVSGGKYLKKFAAATSSVERGKIAVEETLKRVGKARACSVMTAAALAASEAFKVNLPKVAKVEEIAA